MSLYRTRLINEDWKQAPQWTLDYMDAARRAAMKVVITSQTTFFVDVAVDSADNRGPDGEPIIFHTLTVTRNAFTV